MPRRARHTPGAIGPRATAIRNAVAGGADAENDDDNDEAKRPTPLAPLQEQPFAKQQRDVGTHLNRGCDEEGVVRGSRRWWRREGREEEEEGERTRAEEEANDSWWTPPGVELRLLFFVAVVVVVITPSAMATPLAFVGPARQLHISCESTS